MPMWQLYEMLMKLLLTLWLMGILQVLHSPINILTVGNQCYPKKQK